MTSTAREDGTRDQMCSDKVQESDSQCINTATSALWISLPYLEISPQCNAVNRRSNSNNMCQPDLTAAFVKIQLIRATRRAHLLRGSDNGKGQKSIIHFIAPAIISSNVQQQRIASQLEPALTEGLLVAVCQGKMADEDSEEDLLCFPTNDPTNLASWPCKCRGFARSIDLNPLVSLDWEQRENQRRRFPVIVTDSTLVRVLPCYHTQHCGCNNAKGMMWKDQLTGDTSIQMDHNWVDGVFATHNSKTTLPDLTLRMQRLLTADPVNIGTTANALEEQALRKAARLSRERKINVALRSLYTKTEKCGQPTAEKISEVRRPTTSTLFRDGALLVHSPDHGDGKTALVQSIAQCRLGFRGTTVAVHVIRLVAVMARYGVHADTALQCTIHAIAMQSAVRNRPVCIILDGLEAIISPLSHQQSASSSLGDASLPVLLGIRSYIQILSLSLQQRHEIPFPSNNPLYNWTGDLGSGTTLPLHLCLVGIMTCPDRQWNGSTENAIFPGAMGVYRLPNLTSATRCAAFRWAFASHGITMGKDLEDRLPFLSASAIWARGAEFQRVAHRIRSVSKRSGSDPTTVVASLNDAAWVFAEVSKTMKKGSDVQFMASAACENIFDTVGGNKEAKTALEEALALDVDRRNLLASFGLKPATGILLYGPPGTGKTMLAKAVAKTLRAQGVNVPYIGGAFISLSSADIVRAEVGTSEKMVLSSFQTARANAPSVIFIDEFQALFTERSRGGSSRLSSTLLDCMDDLQTRRGNAPTNHDDSDEAIKKGRVLVLAATNTPWMVDSAFLRPGRFDRVVHVGLPKTDERKSILLVHIERMRTEFSHDFGKLQSFCRKIATRTEGFSGADISALCRAAAVRCLDEQASCIEEKHFEEVLDNEIQPSCSKSLVEKVMRWRP